MCVLPDHQILEMMNDGELEIQSFSEGSLTPNGYDLRIAEVSLPSGETVREGTAVVPPGTQVFVSTVEYLVLPEDLCAQLWLRTTWIRRGLMAGLGKVDAGFQGTLTFSAFNLSQEEVEVPVGERFVQIVFERLCSPPSLPYERRSGNYQGQRGVTLDPLRE